MAIKAFQYFSNAVRAKEIFTTLVRNGFAEILDKLDIPSSWLAKIIPARSERLNTWERIRVTCEDLGPTFIKIAQILSTRPDILPEALIHELKKLRKQVRPIPQPAIIALLENELKAKIDTVFSEFPDSPVACASLGQVYKARLRSTNQLVSVKVQKPGSERSVRSDLEIMEWFAKKIDEKLPEMKPYDFPGLVTEVGQALLQELDFRIEARNASYFNTINLAPEKVFAPRVIEEYSTKHLLIAEWAEGESPEDLKFSPEEGRKYAEIGANSVFHQIIEAGFFHADPHSGNILITTDGKIAFLDWGQIGHLTRKMRFFLADLFAAIASQNAEKVVQVAVARAISRVRIDESKLEREVSFILRKYQDLEIHNLPYGRVVIDLLYTLGTNGIHLAKDYALLGKAIIAIEDAGKILDPSFDVRTIAKPYLKKLEWEKWNPATFFKQIFWSLQTGITRLKGFPSTIERLFTKLEDGELKLGMHHTGLDSLEKTLSTSANRLVMALIIGALIIGSSMIITTGVQPFIWGYPSIGIIGFLLSGCLGLYLVLDIFRHGRHK